MAQAAPCLRPRGSCPGKTLPKLQPGVFSFQPAITGGRYWGHCLRRQPGAHSLVVPVQIALLEARNKTSCLYRADPAGRKLDLPTARLEPAGCSVGLYKVQLEAARWALVRAPCPLAEPGLAVLC